MRACVHVCVCVCKHAHQQLKNEIIMPSHMDMKQVATTAGKHSVQI